MLATIHLPEGGVGVSGFCAESSATIKGQIGPDIDPPPARYDRACITPGCRLRFIRSRGLANTGNNAHGLDMRPARRVRLTLRSTGMIGDVMLITLARGVRV